MSGSRSQKKLQRTRRLASACCRSRLQSLAADSCPRSCTCNACNALQGSPHHRLYTSPCRRALHRPPLGKDFGQFREQLSKVLLWWALSCTAASDGTVYGAHRPIVGASAIGTRIRVAQQILILWQEGDITPDCYAKQKQAKTTIIRQKSRHTAEATAGVLEEVPVDLRRMVELAAEKGASSRSRR